MSYIGDSNYYDPEFDIRNSPGYDKQCKDCKYFSSKHFFCSYKSFGAWYDDSACYAFVPRFSSSSGSSNNTKRKKKSGCFLTTACCQYKGLPDDCYELQTLRKFRDEVLPKMDNGPEITELYYEVAPQIVAEIEKADNKNELLEYIYNKIYC